MNILVTLKGGAVKILIDELPHLCIFEPILSYQSWISQSNLYIIEYKTKNQTIKTEYDCLIKWTEILKQLNTLL